MKIKVHHGGRLTEREFDASPFGDKVLHRTLKDAVVMYQANARLGTAKTKERGEIAYSRKKPWAQKHTGRARAGDKRSPIWRGGGTVFGPRPRDWSYRAPVQARRVALRSALCGKLRDGEVVLFDSAPLASPSAKAAREILRGSGALERGKGEPRRVLVLIDAPSVPVWKSFRNFPRTSVRAAADLCALDVARARIVLAEERALESLARRVGVAPEKAAPGEAPSEVALETAGGAATSPRVRRAGAKRARAAGARPKDRAKKTRMPKARAPGARAKGAKK